MPRGTSTGASAAAMPSAPRKKTPEACTGSALPAARDSGASSGAISAAAAAAGMIIAAVIQFPVAYSAVLCACSLFVLVTTIKHFPFVRELAPVHAVLFFQLLIAVYSLAACTYFFPSRWVIN